MQVGLYRTVAVQAVRSSDITGPTVRLTQQYIYNVLGIKC
jgi:hypothetical protein